MLLFSDMLYMLVKYASPSGPIFFFSCRYITLWFQRLPPARGGTAQKKIIHLANWSQLIHPGPASSLTKVFFGVESVMRVNADSLLIRAAATSTSGTLNDLTTDLIMANNNNNITLLSSTASHISAQCHCISAGHQLYTLVAGVGSLACVPLSVVPLYNRMWCHHHSTPICSYCICIFQLSFSFC